MPRKEFESFTRLDASDVNTFLMDQSVMTFAGTAARGSAITTPVEGMYAHLNDTDTLTYYDGSDWVNRIGASAGILQVVSTVKSDTFSMASTTFADITDFSVTITPTSATSKIFVIVNGYLGSLVASVAVRTRLMRGATAISVGDAAGTRVLASTDGISASANHMTPLAISFLDSPATTSATTYKVQMQNTGGGPSTFLNRSSGDTDGTAARTSSSITVMEVAA
jgi:hypothetical protein